VQAISSEKNRVQKVLEDANVKLSVVRVVRVAPSLFKIVPLDFQSLSENLLKYQICFNSFHKAKG